MKKEDNDEDNSTCEILRRELQSATYDSLRCRCHLLKFL